MNFRDLAVAARVLRKSPVFALTAVLTIAFGVGASVCIREQQRAERGGQQTTLTIVLNRRGRCG